MRAIVETWRLGVAAEAIPQSLPHLTLAQVFDALSYYSDHRERSKHSVKGITSGGVQKSVDGRSLKQLFIDLYLDEDVDVLVSGLVRARGFGAMTTEAAQLKTDSINVRLLAASRHKTLLTHNRVHFEALARQYFEEKKTHSGIIIAVRRKPQELSSRALILLNTFTADEIENQIKYI